MSGHWDASGRERALSDIATMLVACLDPAEAQEAAVFAGLRETVAFALDGETPRLEDREGRSW